jgi:cell division septum initiation protein DivIVA
MEEPTRAALRVRVYDPAAVDQFLANAAAEQARLQGALAAANDRIEAAKRRLDDARDIRDQVAMLVLEAERQHRQVEADSAGTVQRMLEAADAEAAVIVASARAEVARGLLAGSMRRGTGQQSDDLAEVIDLNGHHILEVG